MIHKVYCTVCVRNSVYRHLQSFDLSFDSTIDSFPLFFCLMFSFCLVPLDTSLSPYAMQIILGEHNTRVFEGTEQLMKTDTIIWHPRQVVIIRPKAVHIVCCHITDV